MPRRRITVAKLHEYERELQGLQRKAQELINKLNDCLDQHQEWAERLETTETHMGEKHNEFERVVQEAQKRSNGALEEIAKERERARALLNNIHTFESVSDETLLEIKNAAAAAKKEHSESVAMRDAIAADKKRLDEMKGTAKVLSERVESLLPGAASAGLAHAFKERKEVFLWPKRIWAVLLGLTLAGMFLAVFFDPLRPQLADPEITVVIGYLFSRVPFAVPIVWWAWYAARRHSQALRLEEDYAHKEALSRSFEGYKKQISELEAAEANKAQTLNLFEKTLDALSKDPGRIYRERNEDGSPFSAFWRRRTKKPENGE